MQDPIVGRILRTTAGAIAQQVDLRLRLLA